ncbi:MAG: YtxH domain-containing protein [Alistipes sp.]|nr:YtxH domain-containing protein [Alistipes sp.]
MKQATFCILSLLGGAILGSAVALALTPKTGKEMRGMVRDFLNDEINKWSSSCGKDGVASCGCEEK